MCHFKRERFWASCEWINTWLYNVCVGLWWLEHASLPQDTEKIIVIQLYAKQQIVYQLRLPDRIYLWAFDNWLVFLPHMMISPLKTQGKDAHSSGIVLNYVSTLSILQRLTSRGKIIKKLDIEQHIYWCSRERQAMEAGISSFPYRWAVPADGKETNQVSLIQWHSPKNGKDPCALCRCPVSCTWPGLKICLIKSEPGPGEAT